MTKYYMGNDIEVERGVVVKSTGKQVDTKIEVLDESGNGAGWNTLVDESNLVEISKADYDLIIECNQDWTPENAERALTKVREVLDNH